MDKNRTIFYVVGSIVLVAAGLIGLTLYYTLPPREGYPREDVVADCGPIPVDNEDSCKQRNCEWREPSEGGPWCIFRSKMGYRLNGPIMNTTLGQRFNLERISNPGVLSGSDDIIHIVLEVEMHSDNRLRIRLYDPAKDRYEVPKEAVNISQPTTPPANFSRLYDVVIEEEPQFGLKVIRRSSGVAVFDTTLPGLTFSEQYLQLTTRLPSDYVYGLGEHNHRRLRHDMGWKKWSIFTRDVAPVDEWNLYGAQPFYTVLEDDGSCSGVFLLNSNAMDVVLQPEPHPGLTYHVIGGILDLYIFLGPSPEGVVQQYTEATGRPVMVPYWSLGFQLSRWDYDNLTHVRHVVDRNRDAGIPQDVQYGDIDYMESYLDFTYDFDAYAGLPEFVHELHDRGQHYIVIKDNFIGANQTIFDMKLNGTYLPYEEGVADKIFIMDPRNPTELLKGEVWPGLSVYPDFTLGETTKDWWKRQCEGFYYTWRVEFDALWVDMNEPSNFIQGSITGCDPNNLNYPPYVPKVLGAEENGGMLYDKTICMDAQQGWGLHYDVHSLYGHSHAIATYHTLREMFPTKRPLVLTRSNYAGTQSYAVHWLGDNQSLWEQLHWSIIGMLEYSIFGFSYTGADICGFWYEATEQMCQRWHQLGAFYPYARNHNAAGWPDQDPAAFSEEMIRVTRDVLMTRYKLLPFLYTLLHHAHTEGSTVARPLFHEWPTDSKARIIDAQFLWGPSLMISPALIANQVWVNLYVPPGRWYDYYGGKEVIPTASWHNVSTPLDKINLHVRGGHIIPWQTPANTTVFSRRNSMGLIVALGESPNFEASGDLFWDDGESWDTYQSGAHLHLMFHCKDNTLTLAKQSGTFVDPNNLEIDTVNIFGLERNIAHVFINGTELESSNIDNDSNTKSATLRNLGLSIQDNHTITWHYEF